MQRLDRIRSASITQPSLDAKPRRERQPKFGPGKAVCEAAGMTTLYGTHSPLEPDSEIEDGTQSEQID